MVLSWRLKLLSWTCVPDTPPEVRDALLDDAVDLPLVDSSRHVSSYLVDLAVVRLVDSIHTLCWVCCYHGISRILHIKRQLSQGISFHPAVVLYASDTHGACFHNHALAARR